ncbi:hypothetical protein AMTRI_Chr06g190990 [Amborella trichopoda]
MNILTWNIRGLGQSFKWEAAKDMTAKHLTSILALIETKQPDPTLQLIRHVWGRRPWQWASLPVAGALGGIWVVWNPSDHLLLLSHIGEYSVIVLLSHISNGFPWKFSGIYGPNSTSLRALLWAELDFIASLPHSAWYLGGDFNITRWSHERNSNSIISQGMMDFSDFISRNELLEIPLQGNRFTWSNHSSQPSLSKLDRLLLSSNWEEQFPGTHALAIPKPTSDHCPILLDTLAVRRGLKPFRFELAWLEENSLSTLIPTWWNSFSPWFWVELSIGSKPKYNFSKPLSKPGVVLSGELLPNQVLPSKYHSRPRPNRGIQTSVSHKIQPPNPNQDGLLLHSQKGRTILVSEVQSKLAKSKGPEYGFFTE